MSIVEKIKVEDGTRKVIALPGQRQQEAPTQKEKREDACSGCFYAEFESAEGPSGLCHVNPPQVFVLMSQDRITGAVKQDVNACFPPIGRDAWCGMFEPAIEPLPEKS